MRSLSTPLRQTTLAFLLRPDALLLAMKKRGFGMGRWNGVGGKPHPDETIEQAARREMEEEIGVIPISLLKVGIFTFRYEATPNDNQEVHTFVAREWQGEPQETDEMRPQWFDFADIPYDSMWPDDRIWLPRMLAGNFVRGEFLFNAQTEIINHTLKESPLLP